MGSCGRSHALPLLVRLGLYFPEMCVEFLIWAIQSVKARGWRKHVEDCTPLRISNGTGNDE